MTDEDHDHAEPLGRRLGRILLEPGASSSPAHRRSLGSRERVERALECHPCPPTKRSRGGGQAVVPCVRTGRLGVWAGRRRLHHGKVIRLRVQRCNAAGIRPGAPCARFGAFGSLTRSLTLRGPPKRDRGVPRPTTHEASARRPSRRAEPGANFRRCDGYRGEPGAGRALRPKPGPTLPARGNPLRSTIIRNRARARAGAKAAERGRSPSVRAFVPAQGIPRGAKTCGRPLLGGRGSGSGVRHRLAAIV
jgi:hypothetical protein